MCAMDQENRSFSIARVFCQNKNHNACGISQTDTLTPKKLKRVEANHTDFFRHYVCQTGPHNIETFCVS